MRNFLHCSKILSENFWDETWIAKLAWATLRPLAILQSTADIEPTMHETTLTIKTKKFVGKVMGQRHDMNSEKYSLAFKASKIQIL